ncbi:AAA family ATPase [Streptomyces sp. NPDC015220]|uniref:AAA family ATPase n=1 Tax=Streptomyces sp. NPDC015220 TaxID=3364947 RepID=UPI0036FC930B
MQGLYSDIQSIPGRAAGRARTGEDTGARAGLDAAPGPGAPAGPGRGRPVAGRLLDERGRHRFTDSALLGRDRELRAVDRFLTRMCEGADVLVLSGDIGVGKSALLQEAARAARRDGFVVVEARGRRTEADLTGAGLTQVLLRLDAAVHGPSRCSADQNGRLSRLVATDDGPHAASAAAHEALTAICAPGTPVLLTLDDSQWFDTQSLKALVLALRRMAGHRVGLLVAARAGSARSAELPLLSLGPLDAEAAERLLRRTARFLAPPLFRRVLTEAAGNPAGIIGIARGLDSQEVPPAALLAPRLPLGEPLREKVAGLLDGVPDAARDFLLLAAEAHTDRMDVLREAARLAGLPVDGPAGAEWTGLVTVRGERLRFRHPLLRSAVHWSASFAQRRRAHLALAGALTGDPYHRALHTAAVSGRPDEATAAALEEGVADDLPQAATVLELAADLSPERHDQVRRLVLAARAAERRGQTGVLRRLVGRITDLPVDPDLTAAATALEARVAYQSDGVPTHALSLLMRSASSRNTEWPPPFLPLTSAISSALCEPALNRALTPKLEAMLAENPARQRCAYLLSALCWADRPTYAPAGRALLDLSLRDRPEHEVDDPSREAALAVVAMALDDPAAAHTLGSRALEPLVARGHFGTARQVLAFLQMAHVHLGDRTAVLSDADLGLHWARTADDTRARLVFEAGVAQVQAWEGEQDGHRTLTDGILSFALPRRLTLLAARARWSRGLMSLAHGRPEEAYEELRMLWHADGDARHPFVARWALGDVVAAAVASGRDNDVRPYMEQVAREDRQNRSAPLEHLVARSRALLSEDGEEADGHFTRALSLGGEETRFERARTHLAYGEWLRRQRRVLEARVQLQRARDIFAAIGAGIWSRRAASELLAAGEAAPSAHPAWAEQFRLTPREAEVARLAASGLTNQKIGWQLGLTHRTVASHLSRVFVKIGIGSRKQLPSVLRA